MKTSLLLLAAASTLVFCVSVYQFNSNYRKSSFFFPVDVTQGLSSTITDPVFLELRNEYRDKIDYYKEQTHIRRSQSRWLSLAITFLTALSTFISAVAAVKRGDRSKQRAVIVTSFLTCFATLGTWGMNELTEMQNAAVKNSHEVAALKAEFFLSYQEEIEQPRKQLLIARYADKLDEY